jgi:hypothetical protein
MYNKQIAKEILGILRGLEKRKNKEMEMYKRGELSIKAIVLFVSNHYFDYKTEQIKKEIFNDEQIANTIKMYEENK